MDASRFPKPARITFMSLTQRLTALITTLLIVAACTDQKSLPENDSASTGGQVNQPSEAATAQDPMAEPAPPSQNPLAETGKDQNSPVHPRASLELPYLPTESRFLHGTAVSSKAVEQALRSENFDELILTFEKDMGRDRDAQDLTALYKRAISQQLDGDANLSTFVCGTSLCVGSIHTSGDNSPYLAWRELFGKSETTPNYMFADIMFDRGRGNYEDRFFFSSDPASNKIRIPPGG